ncbi:MAG: 50S ribosomal protein L15 [Candidatus Eremiobacteraeota bacterium]|nr:50S ribosomal protein L15 [Candidatus Eremiobacteraeota bacterium]
MKLSQLKPSPGSNVKRVRVGRGHGSGLVKTSGKGGKGQTVRSGGGKGPNFEGGQTPWHRRLPQRRGVSQKARSTVIFRTEYAVINLRDLAAWQSDVVVTPQALRQAGVLKARRLPVKVLAAGDAPAGLRFRGLAFSRAAWAKAAAAGAVRDDAQAVQ